MSKMSEIALEIQERLNNGDNPKWIAKIMNIPLDWVLATEANMTMNAPPALDEFDAVQEF
jgi:hypothetical protein